MLAEKTLLDHTNLFSPNYLLVEIKHNDLMSERYKKTCEYLNFVEHLLILILTCSS